MLTAALLVIWNNDGREVWTKTHSVKQEVDELFGTTTSTLVEDPRFGLLDGEGINGVVPISGIGALVLGAIALVGKRSSKKA